MVAQKNVLAHIQPFKIRDVGYSFLKSLLSSVLSKRNSLLY